MRRWWLQFAQLDWRMLAAVAVLLVMSIVMMYSVQTHPTGIGLSKVAKQLIVVTIGLIILFATSYLDYRLVQNYAYFLYAGGGALLVAVILFGQTINGTTGWFQLGGFGFQPVELCKIILLITLARFCADHAFSFDRWRTIGLAALLVLGYAGLVMLQPDLGSTLVFLGAFAAILLLTNIRWRQVGLLALVAVLIGLVAWFGYLNNNQQKRILVFLDPALDPLRSGYNVTQAVVSVGSGQWFGRGLGLGTQSQLQFLPERETDFIFAVIAEELGLIGAGAVIILLGYIMWRMWQMVRQAHDAYQAYFISGVLAVVFIHTVINVGMNLGIMPVTGIPLPFVSAGGSSLLALAFALGLMQNYYRQLQH